MKNTCPGRDFMPNRDSEGPYGAPKPQQNRTPMRKGYGKGGGDPGDAQPVGNAFKQEEEEAFVFNRKIKKPRS